jgi:hypothetical protein
MKCRGLDFRDAELWIASLRLRRMKAVGELKFAIIVRESGRSSIQSG